MDGLINSLPIKIAIVGCGNVGYHLAKGFLLTNGDRVQLVKIYNRSTIVCSDDEVCNAVKQIATTQLKDIAMANADVIILSVVDDAVSEYAKSLNALLNAASLQKLPLLVHTSGTLATNVLASGNFSQLKSPDTIRIGVFYPLQSFRKSKPVNWSAIPLCLYAKRKEDVAILEVLQMALGATKYLLDDSQRSELHLNAVVLNNFTNFLVGISQRRCAIKGVDFEILRPLLEKTCHTVLHNKNILGVQTGPAQRGDVLTINKHLQLLEDDKQLQHIYASISEYIASIKKR